jgi:hypothetical protein
MILAIENRVQSHYTLGRGIDLAKVREIEGMAARDGFTLADMRAFDLAIAPEQIEAKRAAARERRRALV